MNIDELNSCFDSMTPTKEQKERILAGVMNAKSKPVKVIPFRRYATAAAAVITVGVFAAVYSNKGNNDVVPQPMDTMQVAVGTQSNEADYEVKNIEIQDIITNKGNVEENVPQVRVQENKTENDVNEKNFSEEIQQAYPQLDNTDVDESPKVAMNEGENMLRSVPETSNETPLPPVDNEDVHTVPETANMDDGQLYGAYDGEDFVPEESYDDNSSDSVSGGASSGGGAGGGSSAGGGGGGGTSSYMSMETKMLSINEVMNHSVYSNLMPTVYANKFNFRTAEEQKGRLKVIFSNEQGNYMSVSILKDGGYSFYESVITPEKIKNIESHGYMNFAVKCGEYYVIYNVEANDANEVYNMVMSSGYFNN